ncbi:MAG: DNA repair exonuclease [bacterium]|nr:DNA repair exonuclease [bacterium]
MPKLKFLHAADFRLDAPLTGLSAAPDHLRETLISAPYLAAKNVFDIALKEKVDLVVLAGNLLDPLRTGPRGVSFLMEQFERLAKKNIEVFWATAESDAVDRWPPGAPLPDNVHIFSQHAVEEIAFHRGEEPAALIMGVSGPDRQVRAAEFKPSVRDLTTIAVVSGNVDPRQLVGGGVDYWALGGRHDRHVVSQSNPAAYYSGSPQGRAPHESGPHVCHIVVAEETGAIRTQTITTDAVRYARQKLRVEKGAKTLQIRQAVAKRMDELNAEAGERPVLVSWKIDGAHDLGSPLRKNGGVNNLLEWLRSEYGRREPALWTTKIQIDAPASPEKKWLEEDTILGDFLREIETYQKEDAASLGVSSLIEDEAAREMYGAIVDVDDKPTRERVLREAARLAIDMLRGEE